MKVADCRWNVEFSMSNVEFFDGWMDEFLHTGVILEEIWILRIPKIHRIVPPLPPLVTIILHISTISGAVIIDAMLIFQDLQCHTGRSVEGYVTVQNPCACMTSVSK